ncbi:redoxin domain-containing protein [Aliikangiella sp. G2MR2-5]|uniref:redoxin domain-containing protein n=1 Tax=Aliikangiella sp. G2MR2-5 TaxID=2788943 RepID=UPI0018A9996D|nr:redoxin domain-containing protein [Aliikangiella sp. G2MR2-5]
MRHMNNMKPTYEIADPLIKQFVQPLSAGDLAKPFESRDEDGRILNLADDHLSGRHLILIFLNNTRESTALEILRSFAENNQRLTNSNASVLAIHSNSDASINKKLKEDSRFANPVLSDSGGTIHATYGLHKNHGHQVRIVLLTRLRQIRSWFDDPQDINVTIRDIMEQITPPQQSENEKWYPFHAPVLTIPNVFTRDECKMLIDSFETQGNFFVSGSQTAGFTTDFKMPIYEHNRQDRVDQVIRDKKLTQFIDQRTHQRVNPMIKKAFAFDVTRREDLHIARYVGKRGGNEMGHRDNTNPKVAYRRFAFSMNLNDDYQGGGVVFKEFSDHPYRAEPGTVMIFSSSLLHEVQETTSGTRYNLITHLFNDSAIQQPQRRQPEY